MVLARFLDQITTVYPECNFIYDEQLTVESALKKFRAKNNQEGQGPPKEFPLFAFNRSAMKFSPHGMGRRSVVNRAFNRPTGLMGADGQELVIRKAAQATFDVRFLYLANAAETQEIFEVDFLGEDGFSDVKEIKVELPDLGEFNYYVQYSALIDKVMSSDQIYYKTVTGTATILGWFFSLQGSGKWITEIDTEIRNFNNLVLASTAIQAP